MLTGDRLSTAVQVLNRPFSSVHSAPSFTGGESIGVGKGAGALTTGADAAHKELLVSLRLGLHASSENICYSTTFFKFRPHLTSGQ